MAKTLFDTVIGRGQSDRFIGVASLSNPKGKT
jgi:hypothetical protein